jgi:hypothetical protein
MLPTCTRKRDGGVAVDVCAAVWQDSIQQRLSSAESSDTAHQPMRPFQCWRRQLTRWQPLPCPLGCAALMRGRVSPESRLRVERQYLHPAAVGSSASSAVSVMAVAFARGRGSSGNGQPGRCPLICSCRQAGRLAIFLAQCSARAAAASSAHFAPPQLHWEYCQRIGHANHHDSLGKEPDHANLRHKKGQGRGTRWLLCRGPESALLLAAPLV